MAANPVDNLHEHAVQAEKHLEQLATGLGQAGADPSVIQTVAKMADVTRKVVSALGKGQAATGDHEPPAQETQRQSMDQGVAGVHEDMQRAAAARRSY